MALVKGSGALAAAVVAVVVGGAVLGGVTRLAARPHQDRQPLPTRDERREAEAIRKKSGIRAAASVSGRYVSIDMMEQLTEALDVSALIAASDVVLRGTVVDNLSHVSDDGKTIVSDYRVEPTETFLGDRKKEDLLNVRIPGGRVEFGDGTFADITIANLIRPVNSREYLWFLSTDKGGRGPAKMFHLAMGAQGLFELKPEGLLFGLGNKAMTVQRKYHDQPTAVLLNDLRDAAERIRAQRHDGRHGGAR